MVISELIHKIKEQLTDNADFEAREIVSAALKADRAFLIINAKTEVPKAAETAALDMLRRRLGGEPLQYILGFAEFMSLRFKVTRDTLIPRSDTETLVETVLDRLGGGEANLLDIGTGTGCIGISISYYNKNVHPTLVDISGGALRIAGENAAANGVDAKLLQLDIMEEIPMGEYDIIVSNPPYIESGVIPTLQTEVKDYEPVSALDGGGDGLMFYRRIIKIAPKLLKNGGRLFFEIGYNQGGAVEELMKESFCEIEIIKDLCGNDRVVCGRLK